MEKEAILFASEIRIDYNTLILKMFLFAKI